jgi:hypothetical protein
MSTPLWIEGVAAARCFLGSALAGLGGDPGRQDKE